MTTHPERVATPQSPSLPDHRDRQPVSTAVRELQLAIMEYQIAALEQELEAERERRQAVVDRYERMLADRR
jgi:diacylglycerol kinase family enzyme